MNPFSVHNVQKQFWLTDAEINRILFCDECDTKDALILDDDDIYFLEDNVTQMEANSNTGDINVVIDPSKDAMILVDNIGESSGVPVLQSSEVPTKFTRKTVTSENTQAFVCETDASFEYENVLMPTSDDPNPYEIFEKVARFDKFLSYIVIPQTTAYSQQKGQYLAQN